MIRRRRAVVRLRAPRALACLYLRVWAAEMNPGRAPPKCNAYTCSFRDSAAARRARMELPREGSNAFSLLLLAAVRPAAARRARAGRLPRPTPTLNASAARPATGRGEVKETTTKHQRESETPKRSTVESLEEGRARLP